MPLAGGPSDKAGNSFERRWTIWVLIELLTGRAESLRIEVPGEDGVGAEFRLVADGQAQWHQAKRQRAAGPWTVNAMANDGILQPWWAKLKKGDQCVFVSGTGATELHELTERAIDAADWQEFHTEFLKAKDPADHFKRLRRAWSNPSEEEVYRALHLVNVRTIDEKQLGQWVLDRLKVAVTGSPTVAAALLAQLADDSVHRVLTSADVWEVLTPEGITARNLDQDARLVATVESITINYLARLRRSHVGGHELPRKEADQALSHLRAGGRVLVAGGAGCGKSVVTGQVTAGARDLGWPVLVLSADRWSDARTPPQLGQQLDLPDSPVTVLAGLARGGPALLVIDQLDALSKISGRHPDRIELLGQLLTEADSHPNLRILLACRRFDLDNDRELRTLAATPEVLPLDVAELTAAQVNTAFALAGLEAPSAGPLRHLLTVPINLAVYVDLAQKGVSEVDQARSLTDLYDAFWEVKRAACRDARNGVDEWLDVIDVLVTIMSNQQQLTAPRPRLDAFDQQLNVMASEGVLEVTARQVTFVHETFFDYCFARTFIADGRTLRDLLVSGEQDLFRRAQVRQILTYQRSSDRRTYLADLGWMLGAPDVRLHLKALALSLLETVADPSIEEWQLIAPLTATEASPLQARLWQVLRRNPGWFPVLDEVGQWEAWLRADDSDLAERARWAISGAAPEHSTRALALLKSGLAPEQWRAQRRALLRRADLHTSRVWFTELLTAIADGDFDGTSNSDLWHAARMLAQHQPAWGAELVEATLRRAQAVTVNTDAGPFNDAGPLPRTRGTSLESAVAVLAQTAPAEFVARVLPPVREIIGTTARPSWTDDDLLTLDAVWYPRIYGSRLRFSDALLEALGAALAELARLDPDAAAPPLAALSGDRYESSAVLLIRGFLGNPTVFAEQSAAWLLATPGAFTVGYADERSSLSRQLLAEITPHLREPVLDQLRNACLYYATPRERSIDGFRARGRTELGLLNALDPTRRGAAVNRRLEELRRKFGITDVPPPRGITGGQVPPPIPSERARHMTDAQWLRAMRRHGIRPTSFGADGRMIGDAQTQGQVLEDLTREDPERFARLLLDIPDEVPGAYVNAILRGLVDSRLDIDVLTPLLEHVRSRGGDSDRDVAQLIGAQAAGSVPDELLTMLGDIATGVDPEEHPDWSVDDPPTARRIDSVGWNSARGAVARAVGALLAAEPARLAVLRPALSTLAGDPSWGVRAATAAAVAQLLQFDPDLALDLLSSLVLEAPDALLGTNGVELFVFHAVIRDRYADLAALLDRMTSSDDDDARQAGARLLTVASLGNPALDAQVDALLAGDHVGSRVAVTEVAADNLPSATRWGRCTALLSAAFNDTEQPVRDAAQRAFHHLTGHSLEQHADLLRSYAASPAAADDASSMLMFLEETRRPLPAVTLDLCERFVSAHRSEIADLASAASADAMYVVRLALRLHSQHSDPVVRQRCLDLIDELVVLQAGSIDEELDSVER
ncbi:hypothetical protein O2V63_05305 [Modestobacter sp. VKM Ac-2977]|uniref:hypothetical protein n=1 Tax=Modestobacter sp. VKM Ac-2977 TaxID=3004131 RepID=UPI0022AADE4E|nr:hypothetical protein [Modestobacter sp. VKM Ac-2977]MCZ2819740.1 hypothetical protein [Modestobacter sp. VKM Ac-2977]